MLKSQLVFPLSAIACLSMVLAGCADDTSSPPVSDAPESPRASATTDAPAGDGDVPPDEGVAGVDTGAGSLTLTIGDETWEFGTVVCSIGLNPDDPADDFPFASVAEGFLPDGTPTSFVAAIRDESGQARLEGDGVHSSIQFFYFIDDEELEGYSAETDIGWDDNTALVTLDGLDISGTGDFVLESEYGFGAATTPGSFTGTCGTDYLA